MPDVFRGVPFPASRFDWGGSSIDSPAYLGEDASERHVQGFKMNLSAEIGQFVARGGGSYSRVVKKDLENVIAYLKSRGIERATMIGYCFGGVVTVKASQDFAPFLCGVLAVHPALMPLSDAAKVRTPLASLPSAIDDPSFDECEFGVWCSGWNFSDYSFIEVHAALAKNTNIPRPATFHFDPILLRPFNE
jgi:hypothetical protein